MLHSLQVSIFFCIRVFWSGMWFGFMDFFSTSFPILVLGVQRYFHNFIQYYIIISCWQILVQGANTVVKKPDPRFIYDAADRQVICDWKYIYLTDPTGTGAFLPTNLWIWKCPAFAVCVPQHHQMNDKDRKYPEYTTTLSKPKELIYATYYHKIITGICQ